MGIPLTAHAGARDRDIDRRHGRRHSGPHNGAAGLGHTEAECDT